MEQKQSELKETQSWAMVEPVKDKHQTPTDESFRSWSSLWGLHTVV